MKHTVFGIRHHGCGSARSVCRALESLRPDIVLIEGAPEANEIIPLAAHKEIKPPVAILIYSADDPKKAVYYPFAEFSPEWQAMNYALKNKTAVRFIDLPQSHQFAVDDKLTIKVTEPENGEVVETDIQESEILNQKTGVRRDPLQFAAEAAGFSDGEIWWENLVETNVSSEQDLFEAISELMGALREEAENEIADEESKRDEKREAFMREEIRRAYQEGFKNIAVICGAWHAPRLSNLESFPEDRKILGTLQKSKLSATWIPYTYHRLATSSGYRAGISSPEFYHQIWKKPESLATNWLARVASLLREQDLDASSASVIEAVRLAESLAVMRNLSAVGLNELFDSVRAVLCFGDDAPLKLIGEKLIVGERMGKVPLETPVVPLQRDLQASQKRLRFLPEAAQKTIELDLRKANDLERSQLLHRLDLLGIEWGYTQRTSGKGTFKEAWRLSWQPELEISLIEANVWGNTIYTAATNKVRTTAAKTDKLTELTKIVEQSLLADLPEAIEFLMSQLEAKAAVSSDIPSMMDALPPLADVMRYGNVRKTDAGAVQQVVDGLVARICIGLPNATHALDDEAAAQMFERIIKVDGSIGLLQNENYNAEWLDVLRKLADTEKLNGIVRGRAVRLLFDRKQFSGEETARQIGLALSTASDPESAAAWLEGFLRDSGLILLHNENLLKILDAWVKTLKDDVFTQILPLLRRTFSTFHAPERRQIGNKLKSGISGDAAQDIQAEDGEIDTNRAELILPLVVQLLGAGAK